MDYKPGDKLAHMWLREDENVCGKLGRHFSSSTLPGMSSARGGFTMTVHEKGVMCEHGGREHFVYENAISVAEKVQALKAVEKAPVPQVIAKEELAAVSAPTPEPVAVKATTKAVKKSA